MSLIDQHLHAVSVSDLCYLPEIGANSVVCGVVNKNRLCVGIINDSLLNVLYAHAKRDTKLVVNSRIYINGNNAAYYHSVDGAAVYVSGDNYFIPFLTDGKYHGLNGGSGSVYHKKAVTCPESFGGKSLCVPNNGNGVTKVVQWLHGVNVHGHTGLTEKFGEQGIALSVLVTGHVKGYYSCFVIFHQRLVNRRIVLSVLHCLNFPLAGRQAAYGYSPYNSVSDHADCAHKNCVCHMK